MARALRAGFHLNPGSGSINVELEQRIHRGDASLTTTGEGQEHGARLRFHAFHEQTPLAVSHAQKAG
jgi:hypothetical protein